MTSLAASIDRASLHARLADAVTPEEVASAVGEWLRESSAGSLVGVYLAGVTRRLHLDPRCGAADDAPTSLAVGEADDAPGPEARVTIPLSFRGRAFGALLVEQVLDPPMLRETLDAEFAPALFRALYLDDTLVDNDRIREQLFYLDEMGKLIGRLDLDLLLVNVLELTTAHLGADIGSITLMRADGLETAVDWGLPHEALVSLRRRSGTPVIDEVLDTREPLLLDADELHSDDPHGYRFDHLLLLPLCTNDAVWGTINLVSPSRVPDLDSPLLDSIRSGVALAATAVENALLIEMKLSREREQEQLKLGHQIQSTLLPSESPQRPGLDIDGSSVSATMIGGDYFDYFDLPDGRLGLVVADVSGKGVPAGLIMTATRALFRATAARRSRPALILDEVNRLLCAEGFGARFVTAVFASIDPWSGVVEWSTAGHDPPSVWRAHDGTVEGEPLPALPLGLRPGFEYEAREVALRPGDVMLFYTDGVSEAMNAQREQFGEDRLHHVLAVNAGLDARSLRDRILAAIDAHCGATPRHDDTTLIVVRKPTIASIPESHAGEQDRERAIP